MAPRLNKRQMRMQEELQALEVAEQVEQSGAEDSEPEPPKAQRIAGSGFAALMNTMSSDEQSDEETSQRASKTKKRKKKKKKATNSVPSAPPEPASVEPKPNVVTDESASAPAPAAGPSKKERKALKRQKAKEKKDDRDEIDKALAELSLKYPRLQQAASYTNASAAVLSASNRFAALLAVSLPHLDSEAEMRKFFGAKVVSAAKSTSAGASSPRRPPTQRSNLTHPQANWWPAQLRQGLSMRLLTEEEAAAKRTRGWVPFVEERVWTVEYSKRYRGATYTFIQVVMSGDPEGFRRILQAFPYHADTLLQLSEVYHHREEHSSAADFIDRALFAYERAFVGSFNFTSGMNRLDFDRVENRPFFLAIHRQVGDLHRRGCFRTAFEFARLLYAIDPWGDPHGALLYLDFLAIKAEMWQWAIDLYTFSAPHADEYQGHRDGFRVTVLPGWAYSYALALFRDEEEKDESHENSMEALQKAIIAFPSVVPLLADKADITLSAATRGHSAFHIYTDAHSLTQADAILHLLSHLYAMRSSSLWKPPVYASWFAKAVEATLPLLSSSTQSSSSKLGFSALFSQPNAAYSVYRHVVVNETTCRRLFAFIPRRVTDTKHLACDPLPPLTRINEYDPQFFEGAEDGLMVHPRGGRANERMLERLVPDPVFRRQLQDFFEANPRFAQHFPGGVVQFVQMAAQMPEDVLQDMMIAAATGEDGGQGMPGAMPGQEVIFVDQEADVAAPTQMHVAAPDAIAHQDHPAQRDEEEEDEDYEEEEEEEEVAPLPVRLLRNVINRFWGSGAAEGGESSDGEDDRRAPAGHDDDVD
ncbi:DUF654-domain-containing protein [Wolfiporia cocos MD-104 SS10]|uniref:DUF654-domain-containing protein n=1 Tax=Wolfiporia cocos (strain MD-104) TaxID=742152 RepID=A0A2H3JV49_WOLCO|nr:DUF654-domain-containing protein [Wolfiporia cocos MD-104 SS10]